MWPPFSLLTEQSHGDGNVTISCLGGLEMRTYKHRRGLGVEGRRGEARRLEIMYERGG